MLSSNDTSLFCNLLDSLGNSLRELAVKYELLVVSQTNATMDRHKTDDAVASMSNEVLSMSKDLESIMSLVGNGREANAKTAATIQSLVDGVYSLNIKMDDAKSESVNAKLEALKAKNTVQEVKEVALHMDSHMDQFYVQLALIPTIPAEISKMSTSVDEIKKQFEPFKKLAVLFSKPVAIIVGIYVIVATILLSIKGCNEFDTFTGHGMSENSQTNNTLFRYHK